MADPETSPLTAPQAGGVNHDDESRMLLSFLQRQRDAVLKIVEGLPEEAWQTPVVPSGWTVAGMLAHLGGAEHHWFQDVTAGGAEEPLRARKKKKKQGNTTPMPPSRATGRAPTSSPTTAPSAGSLMKCSPSPRCPRPRAGSTSTLTRSTPPR